MLCEKLECKVSKPACMVSEHKVDSNTLAFLQVMVDEVSSSLSVAVMVPQDSASLMNTAGLLGSANGIVKDDFVLRDETILSLAPSSNVSIYQEFGKDCKCARSNVQNIQLRLKKALFHKYVNPIKTHGRNLLDINL